MSVCKHILKDGICGLHSEPFYKEPCHEGPCTDYAAMTNADKIRQMSDEELADYAYKVLANYCCPPKRAHSIKTCTDIAICDECWLNWLKQKAKDEEASF